MVTRGGLTLVLTGSALFLLLGFCFQHSSAFQMSDFKEIYYGARCSMEHCDPYREADVWNLYQVESGQVPLDPGDLRAFRSIVALNTNLPTTLLAVSTLALLPWKTAALLWRIFVSLSFLAGSYLMWSVGARFASRLSACLVFLLLINSELLYFTGNPAGIVIGLLGIAVWCFTLNRLSALGVLSLALALSLKPHVASPIWLYFLLAGGTHRRRAIEILWLVAAFGLLAAVWNSHVSPQWMQELDSNLAIAMNSGGRDDPGPHSASPTMGGIVSLQTLISMFWDNPHVYNPLA